MKTLKRSRAGHFVAFSGGFGNSYFQTTPSFRQASLPDRGQIDQVRAVFGLSRGELEKLLTNGLPGARLDLSFDNGDATFSLTSTVAGKTVFKAEDCFYDKRHGTLTIARDRRESEVRAYRAGLGLGKVFLSNMLDLADAVHARKINLYGGKEDGTGFWPRYGAELEDGPGTMPYQRFVAQVESNIAKAPPEAAAAARAILAEPSPWISVRLANLPGTANGKPAGAALLDGTNTMVCYRLDDPEKYAFARRALGDIGQARAKIAAAFAAPVSAPDALRM